MLASWKNSQTSAKHKVELNQLYFSPLAGALGQVIQHNHQRQMEMNSKDRDASFHALATLWIRYSQWRF